MRMSGLTDVQRVDLRASELAAWYLRSTSWADRAFPNESVVITVHVQGRALGVTREQYLQGLHQTYCELLAATSVRPGWGCDRDGRPSRESVCRLARMRLRDRLTDQIRRASARVDALSSDWLAVEDQDLEAPGWCDPSTGFVSLDEAATALSEVPVETRTVVLLDWAGWDGAAIAAHTGKSPAAVRKQLSRFRARSRSGCG